MASRSTIQSKIRKARSGWVRPTEKQVQAANLSINPSEQNQPAHCYQTGCFTRLPIPERGDWLDDYNESGQSFKSFQRLSMKAIPHGKCNIIELVLVGPFDKRKSPNIDKLIAYTEAFFIGCNVRLSKYHLSLTDVCGRKKMNDKNFRNNEENNVGGARCGAEGQLQLDCHDIFDALSNQMKVGGGSDQRYVLCKVAITMADLYCVKNGEAWNYLFGQAHAGNGVGVFSFARYCSNSKGDIIFPLLWEGFPSKNNYQIKNKNEDITNLDTNKTIKIKANSNLRADEKDENVSMQSSNNDGDNEDDELLIRSCKVLTHETCHLFGIKHCIYYYCLMNGSNHNEEANKKPPHLCYLCLNKLQSSLKFNPMTRAIKLQSFYHNINGWESEAKWNENWMNSVVSDEQSKKSQNKNESSNSQNQSKYTNELHKNTSMNMKKVDGKSKWK